MNIEVYTSSQQGPRAYQQDRYFVSRDNTVVAAIDGMGGHAAGDKAAEYVVEALEDITEWNALAIQEALSKAHNRCETHGDGRGTTATVLWLHDNQGTIFHAGDSRAYQLRGGSLDRLTTDHGHGSRLTNCIGWRGYIEEIDVQIDGVPIVFVLTTDGVHDYMPPYSFQRAIEDALSNLEDPARELVDTAIACNTHDNCTAVVVVVQ